METGMHAEITWITPERAQQMLQLNTGNRNVRSNEVAKIARDMGAGNYAFNGSAIVVNCDGTVLDGQHRLMACASSGVAFQTVLVTGVSQSAVMTIDTGRSRTPGDMLRLAGEINANEIAAAGRLAWRWSRGLIQSPTAPSHSELQSFLNSWPEVRDGVQIALRDKKHGVALPASAVAALTANLLARCGEPEAVSDFVRAVKLGTKDETHPTFVLHRLVTNWKRQTSVRRKTPFYLAVLVKCWNDCVLGTPRKTYMFKSMLEDYPVPLDLDGTPIELIN
jgi:hypothetical protein